MAREHPLFSALYDLLMVPQERLGMARTRARVVAGLKGRILEVGAGTGLNFSRYGAEAAVTAIEPDPHMLRRAVRRREAATAAKVDLLAADAEALPFPNRSFDAVVSTLVFCTIADPMAAARELRRVLKPGGALHFLEHVRAAGRWLSSGQDAIDPLWRRVFAGCHVNRDTLELWRRAGFEVTRIKTSPRGVIIRGEAVAA